MTAALFFLGCALAAVVMACMLYGLYHLLAAVMDLFSALGEMFTAAPPPQQHAERCDSASKE